MCTNLKVKYRLLPAAAVAAVAFRQAPCQVRGAASTPCYTHAGIPAAAQHRLVDGSNMSESKDVVKEGGKQQHLREDASPVPQAKGVAFTFGCCIVAGPAV